MPWTVDDVNKHKKGLSPEQKEEWVSVANATLATTMDEGEAIRTANDKVKATHKRKGLYDKWWPNHGVQS